MPPTNIQLVVIAYTDVNVIRTFLTFCFKQCFIITGKYAEIDFLTMAIIAD